MFLKTLIFLLVLPLCISSHAREIDFTWQAFPEATKYELQVSETKSFKKPIIKKISENPQVKADLNVGQYYYRVRAFDEKNRPGIWSKPLLLSVNPFPPKPIAPAKGAKYNFYEKKNDIEFRWEKLEGKVVYELLIQRTNGKTVLEKKTRKSKIIINKLSEGDYSWKVRAIIQKRLITEYSEPRFLFITKTPIEPPRLIKPADKGEIAAYRDDKFIWEKDEVTKYTDIEIEDATAGKPIRGLENVEGTETQLPMMEPGKYRWRVLTKETKDSEGVSSEWAEFKTTTAVPSDNNHVFRLTTGYQKHSYNYESTRAGNFSASDNDTGMFINLYNRLQYSKGFGIAFDLQEHNMEINNENLLYTKSSLLLDFRFGENDFQQSTILGFRLMDQWDFESGTAQKLSTHGILIGITMDGYINYKSKIRLALSYFKPKGLLQSGGSLTADAYEFRLSYAYNITERFWIDWEFAYDKYVYKFDEAGAGLISRWDIESIAPINIKLSYEY
jgi:hypothetical protein